MAYENLLVDVRDGVGFVTVDREAKHNALEGEAALFGEVAATEDAREGTRAFLEKRPARFAGR